MNSFAIFVIYDPKDMVHDYVLYILRKLRLYVSKLIVVHNTELQEISKLEYVDEVINRNNKGFDAVAYAEAILKYRDEIEKCDELIMANDTFYGPLDSFDAMFADMKNAPCDYWGITEYPGGSVDNADIPAHIQSYFLVFRKKIIRNNVFYEFWEKYNEYRSIRDVIINFEVGLNQYLAKKGFTSNSYAERRGFGKELKKNDNPYLVFPYKLICEYDIPVLKRKSLDITNPWFCDAVDALLYIRNNMDYDERMVVKHIKYLSAIDNKRYLFDYNKLEAFISSHKRVFIYGNGMVAHNLDKFFELMGLSVAEHIVSENMKTGEEKSISDLDLRVGDGIIIAVSSGGIAADIKDNCMKVLDEDDIIAPNLLAS